MVGLGTAPDPSTAYRYPFADTEVKQQQQRKHREKKSNFGCSVAFFLALAVSTCTTETDKVSTKAKWPISRTTCTATMAVMRLTGHSVLTHVWSNVCHERTKRVNKQPPKAAPMLWLGPSLPAASVQPWEAAYLPSVFNSGSRLIIYLYNTHTALERAVSTLT